MMLSLPSAGLLLHHAPTFPSPRFILLVCMYIYNIYIYISLSLSLFLCLCIYTYIPNLTSNVWCQAGEDSRPLAGRCLMRGVGLHSDGKPASFDERVAQHVSLAHDMMVEAAGKIPKLPQGFSLGSPLTRSMQQDLADGKRQAKGGGKGKRSLGETLTKRASKLLKERCSGKALSRAGRGKGSGKGKGGKGRGKNGKSKKALGQAAKNAEPKKKPGRQAKSQQKPSKNPKQPKRARKAQPDAAVVGKPWDALNDQLRQLEIGQQQTCDGHGNWGPVEKSLRDMAKPLIYRLPRSPSCTLT